MDIKIDRKMYINRLRMYIYSHIVLFFHLPWIINDPLDEKVPAGVQLVLHLGLGLQLKVVLINIKRSVEIFTQHINVHSDSDFDPRIDNFFSENLTSH